MPPIQASDPAPSPVPAPAASVSTPDADDFRRVWDSTRRPGDADRTREIGATDAETAPSTTRSESGTGAADQPRADDRTDRDDAAGEGSGIPSAEDQASTTPESRDEGDREDADAVATDAETRPAPTRKTAGVVSTAIAPDSVTVAAAPLDPTTTGDTDRPVVLDADAAPAGAPRAGVESGVASSAGEVIPDASATVDSTDAHADADAVRGAGHPGIDGPVPSSVAMAASESDRSATAPNAPTTSGDAARVEGPVATPKATNVAPQARASTNAATAIPEGFQAVTPTPADARGVVASQSAAAASRPTGDRPRPNVSAAPAAVARADQVNRSIEAARGGEAPVKTEAVMPMAVAPVAGADAGSSTTRLAAQPMPTAGAESALPTPEEGPARTMPGVARGLDALSRQKGGSLVMRLDPPSLGPLRLDMRMEAGRVTVLMTAASETARALLRDNMGSLRTALEDRGLAVDRLTVESAGRTQESSSNARSENRGDGQDARGGQDASGRQDAGDGRSRGRRDDASNREQGRGDDPGRQEAADFKEVLAGAGPSDH